MRTTGGVHASSAFLRVVVVGPAPARGSGATEHTRALVGSLWDAGHAVTLTSWWPRPRAPHAPWSGPVRRLQDADVILLVHGGVTSVPRLLTVMSGLSALERGVTAPEGRAAVVLVADAPLTLGHGPARRLTEALLRRCDAALVHDEVGAGAATALGVRRVCVVPHPGEPGASATARTISPSTSLPTPAASSATRPEERPAVAVGRGRPGLEPGHGRQLERRHHLGTHQGL